MPMSRERGGGHAAPATMLAGSKGTRHAAAHGARCLHAANTPRAGRGAGRRVHEQRWGQRCAGTMHSSSCRHPSAVAPVWKDAKIHLHVYECI